MSERFLQNGFVVQKRGSRFQMLMIVDGIVKMEVEPKAEDRKRLKAGLYDLDMNWIGTQEEYNKTAPQV